MNGYRLTNLKSILKLPSQFWKELAIKIKDWIWEDMRNGEVQEMTGKNYYSPQYAKYKANYMNRFTTMNGKIRHHQVGTKLKSLSGQSVVSSWTASVNMLLTSQTIKGLKWKSSNDSSMVIGYETKDADKILGNEALGRDIRTLNNTNKDKALKQIEDEFTKNITEWERERIVIKVNSK